MDASGRIVSGILSRIVIRMMSVRDEFLFAKCQLTDFSQIDGGEYRKFSCSNAWERLSVASLLALWLYLFLPFRVADIPFAYGQVEEWTVSCLLLSVSCLFLFVSFYRKKCFTAHFTVCDILLLTYLIYTLFRFDTFLMVRENMLALYALTSLYTVARVMDRRYIRFFVSVLAVSLFSQAFYAFFNNTPPRSNLSEIAGIFHNTGIWGGFAGVVFVGLCGMILFTKRNKIILSVLILFSGVLLYCSGSRAAWIGACGGIGFLTFFFLRTKYGLRALRPAVVIMLAAVAMIIFAGRMLYGMKPDSADGRLYIWKISSRMIGERPLFGIGIDKFKAEYMYRQADYFTLNPDSPFARIADETNVPFSEPLKIAIEQGITGLSIFLAVVLSALIPFGKIKRDKTEVSRKTQPYTLFASILITLLVFSCFSYPFTYIQFCFLLIMCLAVLSRLQAGIEYTFLYNGKWIGVFILYMLVLCIVSSTGIRYTASVKKMHSFKNSFDARNPEKTLPAFASLEPALRTNPNYLVSFASILARNGEHARAIEAYKASMAYHVSYSTYMELGRSNEQSGDSESALACWTLASRMIPVRFEPLYLQIGCHHRNGRYCQADSLTAVFKQKERKIDVLRIDRMMREVREWERERELKNVETDHYPSQSKVYSADRK